MAKSHSSSSSSTPPAPFFPLRERHLCALAGYYRYIQMGFEIVLLKSAQDLCIYVCRFIFFGSLEAIIWIAAIITNDIVYLAKHGFTYPTTTFFLTFYEV